MSDLDINKFWEKLDQLGLNEVRIRRAQGIYGEKKLPLVDEWIHQRETAGGLIIPDDPIRKDLYDKLSGLESEDFRKTIAKVKDNALLGYLRYDFDWDPDPRKSTWQAIEINRLLTRRKEIRTVRPTWYGVAVATAIGIASLIVAVIGL